MTQEQPHTHTPPRDEVDGYEEAARSGIPWTVYLLQKPLHRNWTQHPLHSQRTLPLHRFSRPLSSGRPSQGSTHWVNDHCSLVPAPHPWCHHATPWPSIVPVCPVAPSWSWWPMSVGAAGTVCVFQAGGEG